MPDNGPMTVRTGSGPLDPAQLQDWYAVPATAREGRWVRAGFVTSLDGRVTGADGGSGALNEGSEGDHAVFEHLRDWADVVVVGAGTVRAEGYPPLPGVDLAVVSRGGRLPDSVRDPGPGDGDVVLVGGDGQDVPAARVLEEAAARGWRRIVVEGGPSLLAAWLHEGAVDELCVTVRPVLVGGDAPLLLPQDARLDGLLGTTTHLLTWGGDVLVRTRLR